MQPKVCSRAYRCHSLQSQTGWAIVNKAAYMVIGSIWTAIKICSASGSARTSRRSSLGERINRSEKPWHSGNPAGRRGQLYGLQPSDLGLLPENGYSEVHRTPDPQLSPQCVLQELKRVTANLKPITKRPPRKAPCWSWIGLKSWRHNWDELSTYFMYPPELHFLLDSLERHEANQV